VARVAVIKKIIDAFTAMHGNACRRAGVQIGTIDALLAQLCVRHQLSSLTADKDFANAALHCPLKVWK
jgi:predicted nucleic acid-binding protein